MPEDSRTAFRSASGSGTGKVENAFALAGTLPGMAASRKSQHKFQPPKGTRDFYPEDMAVRRHIERAWREVSINHGFEEIEGPTFEHLELYTMKSGEEIVSELFSFRRAGGETDYALRPEFTPTLARMVATRAAKLAKPIKWFCIPNHYRAERPQRGRLREFGQWNGDVVGDDSPRADAEVIACAVGVLENLGLSSEQITVKISHRDIVMDLLKRCGVEEAKMDAALSLLDKKDRLPGEVFGEKAAELGLEVEAYREAAAAIEGAVNGEIRMRESGGDCSGAGASSTEGGTGGAGGTGGEMDGLLDELDRAGVLRWCEFDLNIVRGLAYYTGTVFEVHESTGKERAIAGGGRYDKLVEMFGGPATPAVGIAMGDVVLRLVLEERGLLEAGNAYMPRPDVFIINARDEEEGVYLTPLLARLRGAGWHARRSYRATKNVGKLLGEAGKMRARFAVILGEELGEGKVVVKDLEGGEQRVVLLDELEDILGEASASCGC